MRDASAAQITGNAEIQNIKQILGLQHGKVYTDAKSLRYGHLMIMTDQVRGCVQVLMPQVSGQTGTWRGGKRAWEWPLCRHAVCPWCMCSSQRALRCRDHPPLTCAVLR